MLKGRRYRDLTILDMVKESLIFSCDTSASIGFKEEDYFKLDPKITGRYCLRVALLEILAVNANPILLFNLVGNELDPTGNLLLEGIQSELDLAGYSNLMQNGSSEENMPTSMTNLSILLVGKVSHDSALMHKAETGNIIVQLGRRAVGKEVLEHENEIIQYSDIEKLRKCPSVKEIVPVGSKGIAYEAKLIAEINGLKFELDKDLLSNPELEKSAGPATTILVAVEQEEVSEFVDSFKYRGARIIGKLV